MNGSQSAVTRLGRDFMSDKFKVAFIQEPPKSQSASKLFNCLKNLYKDDKPRASILIDEDLYETLQGVKLTDLSSRDQCAVGIMLPLEDGTKKPYILCSKYFPGNEPILDDLFVNLITHCKLSGCELILGCDSNSWHLAWNSPVSNKRGKTLAEYLYSEDMIINNVGSIPTFFTSAKDKLKTSIIDLTLSTEAAAGRILSWMVDTSDSGSDHRIISFSLNCGTIITPVKKTRRSVNWIKMNKILSHTIPRLSFTGTDIASLESEALSLREAIIQAFDESIVRKKIRPGNRAKMSWYTEKLNDERRKLKKEFRTAYNTGTDAALRKQYRQNLNKYIKKCKRAKREAWRRFCEEMNTIEEAARLQKYFENGPQQPISTIRKPDGSFTKDSNETQETLLTSHHIGCRIITNDTYNPTLFPSADVETHESINKIVSNEKIRAAINSFSPFKSPGGDGIFPAMLQKNLDILINPLKHLLTLSLKLSYIPSTWSETLVTFIPKPAKESYEDPKSYRPISLTSFILKTLEKLIDKAIRSGPLVKNPLSIHQHAYQEGKSTESAIHNLMTQIEKTFVYKQISVAVFVDIAGAFDCTPTQSIINSLRAKEVDEWMINWITAMLTNRKIKTMSKDCSTQIQPAQGCPQGGVLSPLLWCCVVDPLIRELVSKYNMHVSAFADDLAIHSKEVPDQSTLSKKMKLAMNFLEEFCINNGLTVNPAKSNWMRFTNRTKKGLDKNFKVELFGGNVPLTKSFKYLGVTVDSKLNMNEHIRLQINKACKALWATRRMIARNWGLQPRYCLWIYKQIILPRVLYGSIAFWKQAQTATNKRALYKLQGLAMVMISGASRNTPRKAIARALDAHPIHILIQATAIATCNRLKLNNTWRSDAFQGTHGKIENVLATLGETQETDICKPNWGIKLDFTTTIKEASIWNKDIDSIDNPVRWWSDGSRMRGKTGTGIYSPQLQIKSSFRLNDESTIMQAELHGIEASAYHSLNLMERNIIIHSDSQAALKALSKGSSISKTVTSCINTLNKLALNNTVYLWWIPAHRGHAGNEIADGLAKGATLKTNIDFTLPDTTSNFDTRIRDWILKEADKEWLKQPKLEYSKTMLTRRDPKRSRDLTRLNRKDLRVATGMLTGAGLLNHHLFQMGKKTDDRCRHCNSSPESFTHLLIDCPYQWMSFCRMACFNTPYPTQNNICNAPIHTLIKFAQISGIYESFNLLSYQPMEPETETGNLQAAI